MTVLLFVGDEFYPAGGIGDLVGVYESTTRARKAFIRWRRAVIVDEGGWKGADDDMWGQIVTIRDGLAILKLEWRKKNGWRKPE